MTMFICNILIIVLIEMGTVYCTNFEVRSDDVNYDIIAKARSP